MSIRMFFKASSDKKVMAAIRAKGPRIVTSMRETLDELMLELLARVQQKLSGEVLQNRGGALLRSARKKPTTLVGGVLSGGVQAGSAETKAYAMVQELGGKKWYDIFPGAVTGKSDKQALAFFPQGSEGAGPLRSQGRKLFFKQGKRAGTLKPGKEEAFAELGGVVVRHVHHPPLIQRSYMRSSLEEMRQRIKSRMYEAAAGAIKVK